MQAKGLITDELRSWIGKELASYVSDPVTERQIRRFAQAIAYEPPLYTDPEYARDTPYQGIIAPPLFVRAIGDEPSESEIPPDGSSVPEAVLPFPPELPRRMGGANEFEFFVPVRPGDVLSAKRRVVDIQQREGRSGTFLLAITETKFWNQRGELVATQRFTYIAR
ncbi:MAG: MaoC family dehydratase N-terminal domain-containing protein [Dehalococcoidia bacterium]